MTGLDRAAMAATLAAFLVLPWSLPVAAQTVLETTVHICSNGVCEPSKRVPPERTVIRCLVIPQVPKTAFLIRCLDLFLGTVSADPRVNGFVGSLICMKHDTVSCPDVTQATVKDHPEPLLVEAKLDCTVRGHYMTADLTLECVQ